MESINYHDLNPIQRGLLFAAAEVMEKAYNPYSKFSVGAAIRTKSGDIILGANVENASYGCTICAERSALVSANALGHKEYESIAVIAKPEKGVTEEVTGPCGICRQMILEAAHVSNIDIEIIMSTTDMKRIIIAKISELLPLSFGPNNLK